MARCAHDRGKRAGIVTGSPPEPGAIHFAVTHSAAGGLRELWNDLAEGLAARGHRVGRFALYPPDRAETEAVDFTAWHHVTRSRPRNCIDSVRLLAALVRFLRRARPAAVVSAMPACNVLLPLAVAVGRVPTRVYISHHSPTGTHNRLLDRIDGLTGSLPCVAAVISVSDAVAASLARKPGRYRAKRRTIHNALPASIERQLDELVDRAPRGGTPLRIVALGRLTEQKNYPMLLRAMTEVSGAVLELVGGGADEAALCALAAELDLQDKVTFAGPLPRDAALTRAASADIFAQVSLYEGHSLALIEAARLALPLIVSDVPVQVEGITARDGTRCGIVVPLGCSDALAAQINRLVADPAERARWSMRARRLGLESSSEAMLDAYAAMLAPSASAG